jgi:hypothetical protein
MLTDRKFAAAQRRFVMSRFITVFFCIIIVTTNAIAQDDSAVPVSPISADGRSRHDAKFLLQHPHNGVEISQVAVELAGGRVLASYDGPLAVAVAEPARDAFLESMASLGVDVRELDDMIYTPRRAIDPQLDMLPRRTSGAGLFLLQYAAPATPAWQAALRSSGVVPIISLPERAIVVVAAAEQIDHLARLPWVQYAGPYDRDYKFAPAGEDHGEFVIQIADTELTAGAIEYIEALAGGFVMRTASDGILTARIRTDRATAEMFLDEPFVVGVETFIEPQPSDERQALSLTGESTLQAAATFATTTGTGTGTNYRKWLNKYGFTAAALTSSNIVVDIADYGVDLGCSSDTGSIKAHLDLRGRIVYHNGATKPGGGELGLEKDPDFSDTNGHGTLVAGIVAGNPLAGTDTAGQPSNGRGELDTGSFYWGMGVAPGIRIGSTVMMSGGQVGQVVDWTSRAVSRYCNTPTNACTPTTTLCRATVQNHSNNEYESTGTNAGYYTVSASLFDKSVRRADHVSNIPLAVTVSAGNIGQSTADPSTAVLAPATAKNVISVGAVESSRTGIPQRCLEDLAQGTNPELRNKAEGYDVLAYGSRRGTYDNRLKPDLLAPATQSVGPHAYNGVGLYCVRSSVLDAKGNPWYHGASGTSFAAPVAAGSIALLRHFYTARGLTPSPAMYKAMLVAGARSIRGKPDRYTGGTVTSWPNRQQGFGVITLDVLFNSSVIRGWRDQQPTPLLQGQSQYFTATVSDPAKPMRIVLAWTDKEGAVQDPGASVIPKALVNDLDLRATWPDGVQYYGNVINSSGYSYVPGCGRPFCAIPADVLNNVEMLNVDPARFVNTANRTFTVRVWAAVLNGVGVPGASGGANNQDYALFVVNGSIAPQ